MNTILDKYSKHRAQIWKYFVSLANPTNTKKPEQKTTRLIFLAGAIYFMTAVGALIGFLRL